jgi:DNA ligase (NAD+)
MTSTISYEDINKIPLKDLETYLRKANEAYRLGKPFISDELYDLLYENLKERDPENKFVNEISDIGDIKVEDYIGDIGEAFAVDKEKKELPYTLFSLDKIKADEHQLDNWKEKYPDPVLVSEKLDGNSALLCCGTEGNLQLYTRGNGYVGQIISHLIPYLNGVPKDSKKGSKKDSSKGSLNLCDLAVRGELIISKKNWEKVKSNYPNFSNPRNAVAGTLNAKNPHIDVANLIDFVAYEVLDPPGLTPVEQHKLLKSYKFKTAETKLIQDPTTDNLSEFLMERRNNSNYEVDGIVVTSNISYSRPDSNPKYAFAFKSLITQEQVEVTVTNVTWAVSKDGILNPLVHFPVINLNGVNINKATGFNAKFIYESKLGPGSTIIIIRAGDVIPHILQVLKPSSSGAPSLPGVEDLGNDLPDYEGIIFWDDNNVELVVNSEILKSKYGLKSKLYREILIKKYIHFFNVIDVDGVSEGLITRLFNSGFTSLKSILNVSVEDLLKIEGIKDKMAMKIINAIADALAKLKTSNSGFVKLMAASGSFEAGFGERRMKLITSEIPRIISERYIPSLEEMVAIQGIAEITAKKFINRLPEFWKFIDENGFGDYASSYKETLVSKETKVPKEPKGLKFENKKFVFTGFRSKELEAAIEALGGKVTTAVSKNTNYLVVKDLDDKSSSKSQKASDLGVLVITKEELETLLA